MCLKEWEIRSILFFKVLLHSLRILPVNVIDLVRALSRFRARAYAEGSALH